MSKHKHHKHRSKPAEAGSAQQPYMGIALQQRDDLQSGASFQRSSVNLTPGRAPAEGGEEEFPSHERWEQDTYDRPPAEGPDIEESPIPFQERSPRK